MCEMTECSEPVGNSLVLYSGDPKYKLRTKDQLYWLTGFHIVFVGHFMHVSLQYLD